MIAKPCSCRLQHARVERATAEVVHHHLVPRREAGVGGVLHGGRLRLGARDRGRQVGESDDLVEQLALVAAPVGRVGDHHLVRSLTLPLGRGRHDPGQQLGGQRLWGERLPRQQDRHRVADPALELASRAGRLLGRSSVGGLTQEERTVGGQEHR